MKILLTQKFLFEFPIEVFFNFRNFGSVSVIVIFVSTFYYSRSFCWYDCGNGFVNVFRLLLVETMASYKKRPRTWKIVIIKLNSFEKTFWWSCKNKSRSKKFTCPFGLVPMKFLLSDGRITCPGLRASGLRRRLLNPTKGNKSQNL